jgi:asparagine synthase (glutamine-hydrolysing)
MCGIFGVLFHQSERVPEQDKLADSARLLHHRGPDAQGVYAQTGVGLAHTRLSLLDLNPRSNQPFWDRHNKHCLVYNGEIYNFESLRAELESEGISFRTTSDTEVLLESLIHYGADATLHKVEGMFAFAFFNKDEQSLLLARDRFGIKPLVVYDGADQFVFASEVQAMRGWVPFEPDVLSISSYLQTVSRLGSYSAPVKNHSFYKNIRIVPPGVKIEVQRGGPAKYSSPLTLIQLLDPAERERLRDLKPTAIIDELDGRLQHSVKSLLIADAPVGALCSGGVDSSLILAMARQYHNNLAIFHADVVDCSEYGAASMLAKHLKLDLKSVKVTPHTILDSLIDVTLHYGHPWLYHANSVPFLTVSKLVRENQVKAVLTGEGSDEAFIGYPWKIPKVSHRMIGMLKYVVKKAIGRRNRDAARDLVADLHNRFEISLELTGIRERHQELLAQGWTPRDLTSFELLGYHLRTLLHRNDALGMAASIESRFPLLDTNVIKLAVNLPYDCKVRFSPTAFHEKHRFFIDKWAIRQVASRYIPPVLFKRPKMGFHVPTIARIRVKPEFFADSFIADLFSLSQCELNYLLKNADHGLTQKLLFLELWAQVCLLDDPRDKTRSRIEKYLTVSGN